MLFNNNAQKSLIYDGFHAYQRLKVISVYDKTKLHKIFLSDVKMKYSSIFPQMYAYIKIKLRKIMK